MINFIVISGLATVGALVIMLQKQVFPNFPACQRAVLIFNACDVRVLHELCVKPDIFQRDVGNREAALEAPHPTESSIHSMPKRWREPSIRLSPVIESSGPVTGLAESASSAQLAAPKQSIPNVLAAVVQF